MKITGYNHQEVVSKVPRLNTRAFVKSLSLASQNLRLKHVPKRPPLIP